MAASGTAVLAANPSPKSTRAAIRRHVLDQIRSLQSQCFLARHGLAGWPAVLANLKSLLETGNVLPAAPWEMHAELRAAQSARNDRR